MPGRSNIQRSQRIVVLLDAPVVPAWIRRALQEATASGAGRLVLAALSGGAPPRPPLPFRAYEALDRRFFRDASDHAQLMDVSDLLEGCPRLHAAPRIVAGQHALAAEDVERIASAEPDVILKLGFPPLEGELPDIARRGMWSFDHLEAQRLGRPHFFWEMLAGHPVTRTCLRTRTAGGSRVLQQSLAATDAVSLQRSRNAALWKTADFLRRALQQPPNGVEAPEPALPLARLDAPLRAPTVLELARVTARAGRSVVRERRRRKREDFLWFIAVRSARNAWVEGRLDGFRPIVPPPGHFQADPFLVFADGRYWLFYEEAKLPNGRGWIRCCELRADGTPGEARTVLERDGHLSYPCVFRHGDDWFMIPETGSSNTIELWRATAFPWQWKLERVLFEGAAAVDSTLAEHDGRLWLFTAQSPTGGSRNDELFLYSAESPQGPWTPHPANPIVSDVRRARPAGRLFREDGQLYRPAQDCSGEYGSGIWIHRVDQLDRERYRETPVRRLDPDWWPGGRCTHTIDRAGDLEVIDVRAWFAAGTRPTA